MDRRMDRSRRGRGLIALVWAVWLAAAFPLPVRADMGPKPSVRVELRHMGGERCCATLLSETPSTGPASAWDGIEAHALVRETHPYANALDREVWEAFVAYRDPDGYFFLQEGWEVGETGELAWTYYPPARFKLLLYYPETGTFASSGIYTRYAFDSYYTVDLSETDAAGLLSLRRDYDYGRELLALAVRMALTFGVEMLVALLFGFRTGRELRLLAAVNAVTQIALNVLLQVVCYRAGPLAFAALYVLLELAVFLGEAAFYCVYLKKIAKRLRGDGWYLLYSLAANLASFLAGAALAGILPDFF